MEKFGEWVINFSNTKVGIIVASTLCVLLVLAYFFSKTSIGRKALLELRSKAVSTKAHAETTRENVEENLKKQKEENDKKLKLYEEYFDAYRKETFEVLKYVPNAKVKKFILEHENMSIEELVKKYAKSDLKGEK